MPKKIGIIGGGNMGEALIKGLHTNNQLFVTEANIARAKLLKSKYSITIADVLTTTQESNVIILAVKPQDMAEVLQSFRKGGITPLVKDWNKLYISIAAGLTTQFFEKNIGGQARVIRTMPNMPALIGEGVTAICAGHFAHSSDIKIAEAILSTVGKTIIVKESMMDAVTAVSGSGPAYLFLFVEQWIASAKKLGFKETEAKQLVYKTLLGSAHLLEKSEFEAAALRTKVASKGGTTEAALNVFKRNQFDQIFKVAVAAAHKRAKELAK